MIEIKVIFETKTIFPRANNISHFHVTVIFLYLQITLDHIVNVFLTLIKKEWLGI